MLEMAAVKVNTGSYPKVDRTDIYGVLTNLSLNSPRISARKRLSAG